MICKAKHKDRKEVLLEKLRSYKCEYCGSNGQEIAEHFAYNKYSTLVHGCYCSRTRVINSGIVTWENMAELGYWKL